MGAGGPGVGAAPITRQDRLRVVVGWCGNRLRGRDVSLTKSGPVTFTVTFTGADAVTLADANVTLNKTNTADGTVAVSGSGTATRTVTISGITGDGTLGISIVAGVASDNAGNTSAAPADSSTFTVDNTAPVVNTFTVTTPSNSLNIPIVAFSATDAVGVTGYIITTTSTPPSAGAVGWTPTAPGTRTVGAEGPYTLYPWAKDAMGNVSAVFGAPRAVVVDTTAPTISTFTATSPINSHTIPVSFTASDGTGSGVVGYKITTDSTPPTSGWFGSAPGTVVVAADGTYTLYPWAKDAAGNVSAVFGPRTVVVDTTTLAPTLTSPVSDSNWPNTTTVTYTLPEAPQANSVTLTFQSATTTNTLQLADSAAGVAVTFELDPTNVVDGVKVLSATAPTIPTGVYTTVTLSYTDALGNPAATAASTNVTVGHFTIAGNAGNVANALITYTGGTTTSAADGSYSFTVPYNWSGTVTPTKLGYLFTPGSPTYNNVLADKLTENYTAELKSYTISGNAGTDGATLKYDDGTVAATSDASGNYTFQVPHGWSGNVTPFKTSALTTYTFTPAYRSYADVQADKPGESYTVVLKSTIKSTGAYDGYILESVETSSKGLSANSKAATFQLGDDNFDRQYRAILSFDTSLLPENAAIQSVVVRIKQSGKPVGKSPFLVMKGLLVDIRKGYFGTTVKLVASDFEATGLKKVGTIGKTPTDGWYSAILKPAAFAQVSKDKTTQLRLYFTKDDNDNFAYDYMKFYSGNSKTGQPELIITYTVPLP